MRKKTIILFTFIIVATFSHGQEIQLSIYKKIFRTTDSLKSAGQIFNIDTVSMFKEAEKLDSAHPSGFFTSATEHLKKFELNEASFLSYLGQLRYKYYNSVNPEYQPSEDGALLASLGYSIGELINIHLKNDVDNFISILKLTVLYYEMHDFKFFSREKNIEKYNAQTKPRKKLIIELETNKEKYKEQWEAERKTLEENLDKAIAEQERRKKN